MGANHQNMVPALLPGLDLQSTIHSSLIVCRASELALKLCDTVLRDEKAS
jgi:hypothetical protein